jgi:thiamine biosynthesis lipoprotein
MNTLITFKVVQNESSTVEIKNAIEEGFGEFDRIVKKYTRFNENSELSNLNRNSGNWVQVSDEFFMLIEYMLKMAKETDGAFDPTIIDFLEVYGYDKNYDFSKLDNPKLDSMVEKIANERRSWKEIELNKESLQVKLAETQRIDLGGIGKGYAIDCAYNRLIKVSNGFLIDAGGDIRASGRNENGEYWKVGLKTSEFEDKNFEFRILKNEALACSGSWARRVKQFHHLINPKDGKPVAKKYSTVYVSADTGLEADSWATALFVNPDLKTKYTVKFY